MALYTSLNFIYYKNVADVIGKGYFINTIIGKYILFRDTHNHPLHLTTNKIFNYSNNLKDYQDGDDNGESVNFFTTGGPLIPKGTAGVFPKYDKALKSKKIASLEDE